MPSIRICFTCIGLVFVGFVGLGSLPMSAQSWKAPAIYELPTIGLADFLDSTLSLTVDDHDINLGGIGSDLWRSPSDGPGIYWMITDRGPNGEDPRTFPVPEFTPYILKVRTTNESIEILDALPIIGLADALDGVTGLPNLVNPGTGDPPHAGEPPAVNEAFFGCDGSTMLGTTMENPFGANPNGLDTEGLVRMRDGTFWIVEEYAPSLLKVDSEGRVEKRFLPMGLESFVDATGYASDDSALSIPEIFGLKRKLNRGFEGLALSPDEKTLYLALQSPLVNPTTTVGNAARNTRILAFDIGKEEVVAECVHRFQFTGPLRDDDEFDVPSIPGNTARARPRDMKISALVMLDQHRMLVLDGTDFKAKVYTVDLREATNIFRTTWDDIDKTSPSLEEVVNDGALETAGVIPLPKTLVATFDSTEGFPQKIEGMAVLDGQTIAIANDNDFGVGAFTGDAACRLIDSGRESQIRVIRLAAPIK